MRVGSQPYKTFAAREEKDPIEEEPHDAKLLWQLFPQRPYWHSDFLK